MCVSECVCVWTHILILPFKDLRYRDPLLFTVEAEREPDWSQRMREKCTYPNAEGGGRREKARAMVEGKLLIRARLNACLGSHFPCRSSPWRKEDQRGRGWEEKWGDLRGWLRLRETRKGYGEGTTERRRRRERRA